MIDDLFNKRPIRLDRMTCNSGGAVGADTVFENKCIERGIKVRAFSYKTKYHDSPNKVEISDDDYNEGVNEINRANKVLGRFGIHKYMNLLARNWSQVKYSNQVFAIGSIVNPGSKDSKGYYNKSKYDIVSGGTGYAVQMAINNEKEVYVYEQNKKSWFRWSYNALRFVQLKDTPKITEENFAGIGTREINSDGVQAIEDLLNKTFN